MRAYRKSTQHPFCVYLTAEEASDALDEFADAVPYDPEELPVLTKLRDKLAALSAFPKKERA